MISIIILQITHSYVSLIELNCKINLLPVSCIQDTLSSRALGLAAECAREQRYLAYKPVSIISLASCLLIKLYITRYVSMPRSTVVIIFWNARTHLPPSIRLPYTFVQPSGQVRARAKIFCIHTNIMSKLLCQFASFCY